MEPAIYQQMAAAQQQHWWFAARRLILRRTLQRWLHSPVPILEVGCGPGGNLAMLTEFGPLKAVEMDGYALEMARTLAPNAEVQQGWLPDHLPFESESFGLICLFDVLEHVEDDQAALDALFARLPAGGKVLLTVPAYQWLYGAHDRTHHHFRRYTARRLRTLARCSGFDIVRLGYFNTLLFPLVAAARLLAKLGGRSQADDAALPSPAVNRLLYAIFALEARLVPHRLFPFGVSLMALLEKPAVPTEK